MVCGGYRAKKYGHATGDTMSVLDKYPMKTHHIHAKSHVGHAMRCVQNKGKVPCYCRLIKKELNGMKM